MKVILNCLAKDLKNAKKIMEICHKNALIGILSSQYLHQDDMLIDIKKWSQALDGKISIGLGDGNPQRSYFVKDIAAQLDHIQVHHINQVFSLAGGTRALAKNVRFVNAMVSPSGQPGYVAINTGPLSSKHHQEKLSLQALFDIVRENKINGIKFFNMKNLQSDEEYRLLAQYCAKYNITLEPTGGLSLDNIKHYLDIASQEGVKTIIPHVYGSIKNKDGTTNLIKVSQLYELFKKY